MDQVTQYDVGIAGSIIMIGLSIATVILFISFYRRYKKMSQKKPMNNERNKRKSISRNAFRVGSFVLIWILLILAFYRLGSWQLDRAHQVNNPPTTKVSSQPIPIEQIAQPGINIRLSAVNRIVILKGQYVEKYKAPNQTLMTDEKVTRDSAKFTFDVQVMKLDSGNHVLVARKILPANADNLLTKGEVIATGQIGRAHV